MFFEDLYRDETRTKREFIDYAVIREFFWFVITSLWILNIDKLSKFSYENELK